MKNYFKKDDQTSASGFTLIEILVASFVFMLIVITVVGLLVSIIKAQATTLKDQKSLAEVSYVMEYMSRALRMAKIDDETCINGQYKLLNPSNGYGSGIKFLNYKDECQEFYLAAGRIYESKNGETPIPMTSEETIVDRLFFHKTGSDWSSDANQSRVMMNISIISDDGRKILNIQTTVSRRY